MSACTRRRFGTGLALSGLALSSIGASATLAKPRIVIVGGGIGGATAARYLAMSLTAADLTLIEPATSYASGVFSNLYLAGMRSLESISRGYEILRDRHGVRLVRDRVTIVDPGKRRVHLAGGAVLSYDRLVVSPGIGFVPSAISGYDAAAAEAMPHAWSGGPQTVLLRAQMEAMVDGGVFIVVVPPGPMRYRRGPYERASLAAYYFRQFKPRSKVVILDAEDSFPMRDLFQDGWARHYPGMIEWLPARAAGRVIAVDTRARSVTTSLHTFKGDVVNIIPPQIAGEVARASGLVDGSGWCPIDPLTFESRLQPAIHVIGDAADAGDMPKSAFAANSQAKACAFAIAAALTGGALPVSHLLDASYTLLAGDDAVSNAASFTATRDSIIAADTTMSRIGEPKERRRRTVQQAYGWYDAFLRDVFG